MDKLEIEEFRARLGIEPGQQVLSVNPGAEYGPAKRWPIESFIGSVIGIQEYFRGVWLLLGGSNDLDVCEKIAAALRLNSPANRVINLAGKTTLRELAAALSASRLLLTNDTGPMHLAAAVGTRVVGVFGSTSPELTGPGLPGEKRHSLFTSKVGCTPCFRRVCPIDFRCMRQIVPEKVADVIIRLLSDNAHQCR